MKIDSRKAVSTTIVAIIIVVLVIAAVGGIYLASQNHSTNTTTVTTTASGTVVTTTASATSSGTSSGSIPANTIIEGVVGPQWGSDNLGDDVMCQFDSTSMWFYDNYEQLFQYSPTQLAGGNYVPVPWLASNYTESASGLTYTINLQPNVHFHSGNVMTSADVVYSFDRYLFSQNLSSSALNCAGEGFSLRGTEASFKSITANGPNQVVLTLNFPDPNVLTELTCQCLSILDSKLLAAHTVLTGTGANQTSDWGFAWLDAGPADAGTGPYQLTSFTYEQRAELTSFSGYWGGPGDNYTSNVKTIILIPYADATTAQFALEEGQINMVQDETPGAINSISATPGFSIITSPPLLAWMTLYMHPVGPLSNWEVRDAVKDAINYTALTSSLTFGYAKPDDSFFAQGSQGFNSTTADFYANQGPNITGAKALLKDAGYANGFSVNLYTRPSSRYGITFVDMAEILVSDLAAVNITLNINVYVVGQFYDLLENTSLPGIWTVPSGETILTTQSDINEFLGTGNSTYFNWSAKTETGSGVPFAQIDSLYNQSLTDSTNAAATAAMSQLDQLYLKYGPEVEMFQLPTTVAYSNSLSGVVWNSVYDGFIPQGLKT